MLSTIVLVVHVTVALMLIGIVLLQRGKGATIGATFGGSSQTLFGSRGPASTLMKITTGAAILFMVTSILLSVLSNKSKVSSVIPESTTTGQPAESPGADTPQPEDPAGPIDKPASGAEETGSKSGSVGPVDIPAKEGSSEPEKKSESSGPTGG